MRDFHYSKYFLALLERTEVFSAGFIYQKINHVVYTVRPLKTRHKLEEAPPPKPIGFGRK